MRREREARIAKQKTELREKMVEQLSQQEADKTNEEYAKVALAKKQQWEKKDREEQEKIEQRKKRNEEQLKHLLSEQKRLQKNKEHEGKMDTLDLLERIKIDNDYHIAEKKKWDGKKDTAISGI